MPKGTKRRKRIVLGIAVLEAFHEVEMLLKLFDCPPISLDIVGEEEGVGAYNSRRLTVHFSGYSGRGLEKVRRFKAQVTVHLILTWKARAAKIEIADKPPIIVDFYKPFYLKSDRENLWDELAYVRAQALETVRQIGTVLPAEIAEELNLIDPGSASVRAFFVDGEWLFLVAFDVIGAVSPKRFSRATVWIKGSSYTAAKVFLDLVGFRETFEARGSSCWVYEEGRPVTDPSKER